MKHLFTSYGSYGSFGLTTNDPIVIGDDTYYVYRDYGDKVAIWLGVFETTGDASGFMSYAREWLRDRGYIIVEDINFTKIVPSGNYPGMYEAFISVLKPAEATIPTEPFRTDRTGIIRTPTLAEKKEKKFPWNYVLPIGGGVLLLTAIGIGMYYSKK